MAQELEATKVASNSLGEMCEPSAAELRQQTQDLESRNAFVEEQLTNGAQRVAQLSVEVNELREHNEQLREHNKHYEQRVAQLLRKLRELAKHLADSDSKLVATEEQLQEANDRGTHLEIRSEALMSDLQFMCERVASLRGAGQ